MPILPFKDKYPIIPDSVYIAPNAYLIGDLEIGENSSFWFNVTVRADVNYIRIGQNTNVQDGSVIHVTTKTHSTLIGNSVTVGHSVNLHGCTIEDYCLIGIGATVLDGAIIQTKSFVAANCLITPKTVVPSGVLFAGSPGKVKRKLTDSELEFFEYSAQNYVNLKNIYSATNN